MIRPPVDSAALPQLAMPIGGIGAGSISVSAFGGFQDFAIRHRPAMSARPDGHQATDAVFATLRVAGAGDPLTLLLEGPLPRERVYNQGNKAQGFREGGHEGMPRFHSARCSASYPFGRVDLRDPALPLAVSLTAWSPFIPLDDVASGMPCIIAEYTLANRSRRRQRYELGFHASHLAPGSAWDHARSRTRAVPGFGVAYDNFEDVNAESFGTAALGVVGHRPSIKGQWLRGGWFDGISSLWRELEAGTFKPNAGYDGVDTAGRNGASLLVAGTLAPGAEVTVPFVLAWHFPNSNQRVGGIEAAAPSARCDPATGCCPTAVPAPAWRPFYAGRWQDALAVAREAVERHAELRARTSAFVDALAHTTAPAPLLDAVSCNLAILKSPTVLRQENGNVWGWEGCFTDAGCCSGTCTHVWNYAQALPHLFPALERTLREQEYERSLDERGHVSFRAALPDGPAPHGYHAAADGQLGGLMKLWRDWQIGGDEAWLRRLYPLAKRALDFAIAQWDPDRVGALVEPHHNTYDIEFWGPDGMCGSVYVGALAAAASMAGALGIAADARAYGELAERAARFMDRKLFNGEYYEHRVRWKDLRERSIHDEIAHRGGSAVAKLLAKEGPRYQYGTGCLADGVIGAWMAQAYGLDAPFDRERIRENLRAIHRHNFRSDLSRHANLQRPGYAIGAEPGLLLCTWPRGGKPTLPFPYSDEVWTGIEYQVAAHCIAEGLVAEGLEIVAGARSRYDGSVRNPFDEYECGSFYARAMASYALLGAWSGFRYSAVDRTLRLAPRTRRRPFRTFFSAASGWGVLTLAKRRLTIELREGELALARAVVDGRELPWAVTARAGKRTSLTW